MHQCIDPPPDYSAMVRALLGQGHTTRSLAGLLGISQPSVSRLARGHTRELGGDAAIKLIRLAGGEVRLPPELIGDDGSPPDEESSDAA
jgi:transcriptional regulator with XRE-family HTH domain